MIGKEIRLKKLFKKSSNTFILPMDHGITIGPTEGLNDIIPTIESVIGTVDAIVVHKGLVKQISKFLEPDMLELIVHLSASTMLSPDPNNKRVVTSVEQAIKLGATAVSVHVNLGSENEDLMIKDLGDTAEVCDSWGIPLLAMMYVREASNNSEFDPVKIKHAARIAEELGADIVKVNYTGSKESFAEVVNAVKIPVVIAGGLKLSSNKELFEMINQAISSGAKGVALGRNVFQSSNPKKLCNDISKIIH